MFRIHTAEKVLRLVLGPWAHMRNELRILDWPYGMYVNEMRAGDSEAAWLIFPGIFAQNQVEEGHKHSGQLAFSNVN